MCYAVLSSNVTEIEVHLCLVLLNAYESTCWWFVSLRIWILDVRPSPPRSWPDKLGTIRRSAICSVSRCGCSFCVNSLSTIGCVRAFSLVTESSLLYDSTESSKLQMWLWFGPTYVDWVEARRLRTRRSISKCGFSSISGSKSCTSLLVGVWSSVVSSLTSLIPVLSCASFPCASHVLANRLLLLRLQIVFECDFWRKSWNRDSFEQDSRLYLPFGRCHSTNRLFPLEVRTQVVRFVLFGDGLSIFKSTGAKHFYDVNFNDWSNNGFSRNCCKKKNNLDCGFAREKCAFSA